MTQARLTYADNPITGRCQPNPRMRVDDIEFKALVHYWDGTHDQVVQCLDRMHNSAIRRIRRCFEPGVGALTVNQWAMYFPDYAWNPEYAKTFFIVDDEVHSFHRYRIYQG